MPNDRDPGDAHRHRNMQRIGRGMSLPPRADAARRARWQDVILKTESLPPNRGVRFMKQHRRFTLIGSGLIAASIILGVWLGAGSATRVTAATIVDQFTSAIQKALSIHLEAIDLGTVRISGDLVLDRSPDQPEGDTFYAEVHVLLKADNPHWNDLDAAIVICQTPDDAWHYCRGNGGSRAAGALRVKPTEYLDENEAWSDFVARPLQGFGGMPLRLTFESDESVVTYRFTMPQRTFVEQMLRFLLDLSGAETSAELVNDFLAAAGRIVLQKVGDTSYVLHASKFSSIGAFELPDTPLPDVHALLEDVVWELRYDLAAKQVVWWSIDYWPEQLSKAGIGHEVDAIDLPTESADALIDHLDSLARDVEVDETSATIWTIRVVGYPLPTSTAPRDRWVRNTRALLDAVALSIYYDTKAGSVTRAEFHGVGGPDGRITLETGRVKLDPRRLSPDYWVTSNTDVSESSNR